jgi:hypothetical protein
MPKPPKPPAADALGHTEYIPASQLKVDSRYQRVDEIDWAQVREIQDHPNPILLETITVARRANGSNWIIDGQHRWLGFSERDPEYPMPSRVHISQGFEWEAWLYNKLNTHRKNPSAHGKYKSAVAAGEKYGFATEVEVRDLLNELMVPYTPNANQGWQNRGTRSPGIIAIGRVLHYQRIAPELLRETLIILRDAWGDDYANAYKGTVLGGVFAFLAAHLGETGFVREIMVTRMRSGTPDAVVEEATVLRGTRQYSVTACVARVLAEDYNRGRAGMNRVREINPANYASAVQGYLLHKRNRAAAQGETV